MFVSSLISIQVFRQVPETERKHFETMIWYSKLIDSTHNLFFKQVAASYVVRCSLKLLCCLHLVVFKQELDVFVQSLFKVAYRKR